VRLLFLFFGVFMVDWSKAKDIDTVNSVGLKLLECKTEDEIGAVFSQFGIEDFAAKTEFLHRAMKIQRIYGVPSGDSEPKDEDVYNYYLKFYLDGKWKNFV